MKRASWLIVSVILLLSLCGCGRELERPALEDMAMIGVMGFDYVDREKIDITVAVPVPSKNKESTQVYSTHASMTSEAMLNLATKAERTMSLSQLRVILFSEEYARKVGIGKVILDLYRNPIVGENVYIAVVKGKAKDVIKGTYNHRPEINTYLNNLLRPRVETAFSSFSTIHDFVFMMTSNTMDPNLPYLIHSNGEIQIIKAALFRVDRMIGMYTQREGKLIQGFLGRERLPRMSFEFQHETKTGKKQTEKVVFDFVRANTKVRSKGSLKKPVINIELRVRGMLVGYSGSKDLEKRAQFRTMVQELEKRIKKESVDMLVRFQKQGVDPAQLEESIRQRYYGKWTRQTGLALYTKAKINVKVHVDIVGFGTLK
ncbi:Ger(x)C family spore germination protein [Brevibacillus porteri]|uniref:Ger(X)C family spore germination protein n=1 Tax=Brevibacillus porteri TaxID=2126350 RepID=A0ABX5FSX5_9BACL|nr:Ger(x)C family spore germination protein [Brevibacillus porteri]MED1799672.1 Ger(x)C family spore germination protein [Brevibacillus porteri]MED2133112.1 Ger(x)C family spore germination protein [Brevibacillus porteri]MED2747386.1 Ger(x)C family spore germination protein [Brevibacillus porteri]MED2813835.1 Ger(x)C family spore germination protein [Brevibacillus porteri]MED2893024.1 Ger(x)C family spore germination protein [Brevibacillus porteri]